MSDVNCAKTERLKINVLRINEKVFIVLLFYTIPNIIILTVFIEAWVQKLDFQTKRGF
tara:strand:+ start:166 stop:339 length:174 start_codon:yes stop_codon:yes gene_type:complete